MQDAFVVLDFISCEIRQLKQSVLIEPKALDEVLAELDYVFEVSCFNLLWGCTNAVCSIQFVAYLGHHGDVLGSKFEDVSQVLLESRVLDLGNPHHVRQDNH